MKILNGTFLVAGTCIGGGMLALPVMAGKVGFAPAMMIMLFSWFFMTFTGLLYVEATLWLQDENTHLISLSSTFLGRWAKALCWLVYLFISFASLVAYLAGNGMMIQETLSHYFGWHANGFLIDLPYLLIAILLIYAGNSISSTVNSLFTTVMFSLFFILVFISSKHVSFDLVARQEWDGKSMVHLLPIMLTTFSYPGVVPVLVNYLDRDKKKVTKSIILGTSVTLLAYTIWLYMVMGHVPYEGEMGLKEALAMGIPASTSLKQYLGSPFISSICHWFAFFAIATSFIGISLSLYHFLADGLKIPKRGLGKVLLCLLIAIPTLVIENNFEQVFFKALDLSGGIGDAILSGLIPCALVWRGRYHFQKKSGFHVFGGKTMLIIAAGFYGFILVYELLKLTGLAS